VKIRPALAEDWPRIFPFYVEIVEAGETYAFPLRQSPRCNRRERN
jgi:hypothetical protein